VQIYYFYNPKLLDKNMAKSII